MMLDNPHKVLVDFFLGLEINPDIRDVNFKTPLLLLLFDKGFSISNTV